MRTFVEWADKHDSCIYDLCFSPDGTQLVVGVSIKVLVYNALNGSLIQPLRGHKDNIYCVSYANDGKKFASGSADKTVIIWTSKLEGILKYTHNDAIQCLSYNPVSHVLVSCGLTDFGFWTGEQKSVQKHKAHARVTCCSWTCDGIYLAIGLASGSVSIRNKTGEERGRIERPGGSSTPIWSLAWSPNKDDGSDILCIGDWGQMLSFYTLSGKQIGKERNLGYDPLRVAYYPGGEYVLVTGSGKTCELYSNQGIHLGSVGDQYKSWVWCVAARPNSTHVALGCQDGTIAYLQMTFKTVHSLYKERYAYRENMTDVIIQHLITDQKVRIKCRDLIQKIAIYKDSLAVQLPERVVLYELSPGDTTGMHYKVKEKINSILDCSLLVICSNHIVLCKENKLECLALTGRREREWTMDSAIRYIKLVGGAPEQEGLLVGLKGGEVLRVFLDNPFPKTIVKIPSGVACIDVSMSRMKLAVVDDTDRLHVFDRAGTLLYQEPNARSVAWNAHCEDVIVFTDGDVLSIKAGEFPAHRHHISGAVVGFCGAKLFSLNVSTMATVEVPLSAPMFQYIEKKQFAEAYHVACMGIPDEDWEELAHAALDHLDLNIARLAFIRVKNLPYLDLIHDLLERERKGDKNRELQLADIHAFRGKFKEAARLYMKAGHEEMALGMFTDLRMFDAAQEYLGADGSMDQKSLLKKKADWAKSINEPRAAADMYMSAGEIAKAVEIMEENRWVDSLVDVGRKLDKAAVGDMQLVAAALTRLGALQFAIEMHRKVGEERSVVELLVRAGDWTEAFALTQRHPQFRDLVFVPYAQWLAENDKFLEAQAAFHEAGRPEEALRVLEQLTMNAVVEGRYQDAGYYYWVLGQQCLDNSLRCSNANDQLALTQAYQHNDKLAAVYYAYDVIQRYIDEPFTSYMPEALFNIGRYLMNETKDCKPKGVSQFAILYALSKQATSLGAFKLARQVLDRIQGLRVPVRFQEYVDLSTVLVRARPFHDADEVLPMCYRCSTFNPLLTTAQRNVCTNCKQPFVYSFVSFEVLPLVEFVLEDGITDEEAVRLIESAPPVREDTQSSHITDSVQTLQLNDAETVDPFTARIINFEDDEDTSLVTLNRTQLLDLDRNCVLICKRRSPLRFTFYRNLIPDLPVVTCLFCHKAFLTEDYEMQVLQRGFCPFCRNTGRDEPDAENNNTAASATNTQL